MEVFKRLYDMVRAVGFARELETHDAWLPEQLANHQQVEINRLVRHASENAPFYARHFEGIDLAGDVNLRDLPIIDKAILMENFDEVLTNNALKLDGIQAHMHNLSGDPFYRGEYRIVGTSGTSGLRGIFVYDRAAWRIVLANTLRWNRLLGIRPRLPFRVRILSIGADNPMHVTQRIPSSGDVGLFKVMHIEATDPLPRMVEKINDYRPEVILAYPSMAALLAEEQIAGRLSITPRVVSTHSEVLTDHMRGRIRDAWDIGCFNHYGLTEEPHVAADCPCHEGLHIFEDLCVVEIVDEANRPVPDGTPGAKYLLTNLYNFTQPLIRYEVTDVLTRAPRLCSCGRPFSLISSIGGRSEDVLYLPSREGGKKVPIAPLSLEMCVEAVDGISEFAIAHSPERVTVSVVPHGDTDLTGPRQAVVARMEDMIAEAGAVSPQIEVVAVEALERRREKMGKLRLVGAAPASAGGE